MAFRNEIERRRGDDVDDGTDDDGRDLVLRQRQNVGYQNDSDDSSIE